MRKQEEHLQEKSKSNQGPSDISAQLGPPDGVTNFTGSSSYTFKFSVGQKKCEEIEFKSNIQPDALGKKVKMKFETSAGEQWLME